MSESAVAERTEVTAPETTAQPVAPTRTEGSEESRPSGTEREGVVQTGEQAEESATLGDAETPDAEAVAREAEIAAKAAEIAKAERATERREAAEATKRADERQRAERIQGWLTPVLKEFADEYRADGHDEGEINRRLQRLVSANLSLTNDLKASIHIPIQDAVQELITEANGEDGYREWAKEHAGKPPADYFKGYAESVALKTEAVSDAKPEDLVAANKKLKAYVTRQVADAEKRGKAFAEGGTAGSGPSNNGSTTSVSGTQPKSMDEARAWHVSGRMTNQQFRAYQAAQEK